MQRFETLRPQPEDLGLFFVLTKRQYSRLFMHLGNKTAIFLQVSFSPAEKHVALRLVSGILEGWRRNWVPIPWILPNVTAGVPPPPSRGFHI